MFALKRQVYALQFYYTDGVEGGWAGLPTSKKMKTSSHKLETSNEVYVKNRESQKLKSKIKIQDRRES